MTPMAMEAMHRVFPRRSWLSVLVCGFFFVSFLTYYWAPSRPEYNNVPLKSSSSAIQASHGCGIDVQTLNNTVFGLSDHIDYTRLYINVEYSDAIESQFQDVVRLDNPFPDSKTIDLESLSDSERDSYCPGATIMHFAKLPPKRDASSLIFGMATTLERLDDSLDAFSHWAGGTKCRLYALVEPAENLKAVERKAQKLNINLHISVSDAEYNARYFSLVKMLWEKRTISTQWAAIIDDDTFFLSMDALVDRLGSYNPKEQFYIGGLTEDFAQMKMWSFMGYGGAGIFLSVALLEALQPHYEDCLDKSYFGDSRIAHCVYQHTPTKMTWEHGLHQIDIHGDISGIFEWGRAQPLSVHHWKSWFKFDMAKSAIVSSICGDACLLRRWRFSNGWYLTNGFSISKYSDGKEPDGVSMEKTWDDWESATDEDYLHALGPLRPKDEGKQRYELEKVVVDGPVVRQYYVDRPRDGPRDRVVEVVWRPI